MGFASLGPAYTITTNTTMKPTPTNLAMDGPERLVIEWSDGQQRAYGMAELRRACLCATCETERARAAATGKAPPQPATGLTITEMKPVGNYAYKIAFSDGHDTGIYRLDLLRRLGREVVAGSEEG